MPGVLSEASFSAMRDEFGNTLRLLETLGIDWKPTRFRRYLDSLSWAASLAYPREFAFADELAEQQLFFEASSQAQQLELSASMWHLLDREQLRDRLRRVCRGPDLPEPNDERDDARNTLLELATAAIFHRAGFRVEFTRGREDLLASVPGLSPFAVECKRPVSERTFATNVNKLRRQAV